MAGDDETGIMVMRMDEGLDTGPVALAERVAIGPRHDGRRAARQACAARRDLMARALAALERGALEFKPQAAEGVTYAKKIEKGETRIDWSKPWKQVHDHIRGPVAVSRRVVRDRRRAREGSALDARRGERRAGHGARRPADHRLQSEGAVRIVELQRAGAKAMSAEEFLRGAPVKAGTKLG